MNSGKAAKAAVIGTVAAAALLLGGGHAIRAMSDRSARYYPVAVNAMVKDPNLFQLRAYGGLTPVELERLNQAMGRFAKQAQSDPRDSKVRRVLISPGGVWNFSPKRLMEYMEPSEWTRIEEIIEKARANTREKGQALLKKMNAGKK